MQSRFMNVYYGVDRLPYKDEKREVHYPNASGNIITGENNTTKIYFYVGLIGGSQRQWIANIKKPDGTLSYQLCTNGQSVGNDYRIELDIASLYADQVGDVYIGLQGYSGETVIVEDEGTYEISGNPIVLATGTIKIKVNYAPSVLPKGETLSPTTEQLILAASGGKLDITNGILVVDTLPEDTTDYQDEQVVFDKETSKLYELVDGEWNEFDLTDYEKIARNKSLVYVADDRFNLPTFENGKLVFFKNSGTLEQWNSTTSSYTVIANIPDFEDRVSDLEDEIARIKTESYKVVDITEYPTLEDFLESEGEEGFMYLYQLDTTDLTKGYYRYVWENESWLSLGTTEMGLSDYYTKTQVDSLFSTKASKVSVSSTGTSTDEINYITIDGVEKKIAGSGGTGAVSSVNGQTGEVVLTASNIMVLNSQSVQANLERIDENAEGLTDIVYDQQDQINNLKSRGRFLSSWNCVSGLPQTEPSTQLPYEYRAGDYYIVAVVSETTNYIPNGTEYDGTASTTIATDTISVGDEFTFDGEEWVLVKSTEKQIAIQNVAGLEGALGNRYTKDETYSADEVDGLLDDKANDNEVAFKTMIAPASTTLTDEQIAKIINGVKINGTFSGIENPTFFPTILKNNAYLGVFIGTSSGGNAKMGVYFIHNNNKIINLITNFEINNIYRLFLDRLYQVNGKVLPDYPSNTGDFTFKQKNGTLTWVQDGQVLTSAEATYSGVISSNNEYKFTTPLTSLTITQLLTTVGDTMPRWEITFIVGANFVISLPNTISWKYGTPTFEQGEEYTIYIKGNYAYLI